MPNEKKRFSIEDSIRMYGVAILMLVFHHLYCDPQRLRYDYCTILPSGICAGIAIFCHLCVAIYSYITGYGFSVKFKNVKDDGITRIVCLYRIILKSLIRFFIKYWLVFAVFIPMGIVMGRIKFEPITFVKSVFGISNTYNNEWWYVKQYIKMLVLLPLLDFVYMKIKQSYTNKSSLPFWLPVCGVLIAIIPFTRRLAVSVGLHLGMFTLVMVIGYLFAKWQVHEKVYGIYEKIWIMPYVTLVLVILLRAVISTKPTDTQIDWVLTPCFAIALSYVLKKAPVHCKSFLAFLGKYSMYVWLTHTFFMYYYFQQLIMFPHELFLIYLFVLAICACIGVFLDVAAQSIIKVFSLS